jgi:hypothetical protein
MAEQKAFVFDKPKVITQRFEVSLSNEFGRITVIRKEVQRQAHNTACQEADNSVSYEIYREVDMQTKEKVIELVEKEITK